MTKMYYQSFYDEEEDVDENKFRQTRFEQILESTSFEDFIKDGRVQRNLNYAWEEELDKKARPIIRHMIYDSFVVPDLIEDKSSFLTTILPDVIEYHLNEQRVFNKKYIRDNPDIVYTFIEEKIEAELAEKDMDE